MTVVETPLFLRKAAGLMTEEERAEMVVFVGANPEAGDLVPGTGGVRKLRWATRGRGKRGALRLILERHATMNKRTASRRVAGKPSVGQEIVTSLNRAIAWARGEDVPVRVTTVRVPVIDVRALRRKLRLSQTEFAAKFGFHPATLRNWEQGRTCPDGPARVLLAVIARHPEAVEDALRKAG